MSEAQIPSDDELKERLSPLQYEVTQHAGTERAFSGEYWDTKDPGTYHCIVCSTPLFRSEVKFDSGSGWPSFWEAIDPTRSSSSRTASHFMVRTEVRCATCGAHLGHLFPDGPEADRRPLLHELRFAPPRRTVRRPRQP